MSPSYMLKIIWKNKSKFMFLCLYYSILRHLPNSMFPFGGNVFKHWRYLCCRNIFAYCGKNVNIEKGAYFDSGFQLRIGDNSGLGVDCVVPNNIIIGENVMMGPKCFFLYQNHKFERIDIPMCSQGFSEKKQTIIEDDVWIGREVLFTPGRIVRKGSIIAARTCLCKDFPSYSIIGGNPSRLIRSRK